MAGEGVVKYGEVYENTAERLMLIAPAPGRGRGTWSVVHLELKNGLPYAQGLRAGDFVTHRLMESNPSFTSNPNWERVDE